MWIKVKLEMVTYVSEEMVADHPSAMDALDYVGAKLDEVFPVQEGGHTQLQEDPNFTPPGGCEDCGTKDKNLKYVCINVGDRYRPDFMTICENCV